MESPLVLEQISRFLIERDPADTVSLSANEIFNTRLIGRARSRTRHGLAKITHCRGEKTTERSVDGRSAGNGEFLRRELGDGQCHRIISR